MDDLKATLLACIMSRKGGVPLDELDADYRSLAGESIPFKRMGFASMLSMLDSVRGVSVSAAGIVQANTENSAHIKNLIGKQKPSNAKAKKKYKQKSRPVKHPYKNSQKENINTHQTNNINQQKLANNKQKKNNRPVENRIPIQTVASNSKPTNGSDSRPKTQNPTRKRHLTDDRNPQSGIQDRLAIGGDRSSNQIWQYYISGHQLIGDDYFYSAITDGNRYPARYGTCFSGMTLPAALKAIHDTGCSQHSVIMCGSVDAHMGYSFEQMKQNMMEILDWLLRMGSVPVVCTIPPSNDPKALRTVLLFNAWLISFKFVQIIDLHYHCSNDRPPYTNMVYFDRNLSSVKSIKMNLWNSTGRRFLMNQLTVILQERLDPFNRMTSTVSINVAPNKRQLKLDPSDNLLDSFGM